MEKIITGLLTVTVLTSCIKERSCECKNTQGEVVGIEPTRDTKKKAEKICARVEAHYASYQWNCELK